MRFPGLRRDHGETAPSSLPTQIICPVCGLRNDPAARFCRNCGLPLGAPRDPVRGTTSRRADLPSEHGAGIAALVGLAVAVVLLGGAAFLILRQNNSDGDTGVAPRSTAGATARAAGASAQPRPTDQAGPAASVDPGATEDPGAVATLPPRRDETPAPQPSGDATEAPLVADTDWVCDGGDFDDPTNGKWAVVEARWGPRDKWDELTIVLKKLKGKGSTNIGVDDYSPLDASTVTGLDPTTAAHAIVITFDGDVTMTIAPVVRFLREKTIDYLDIEPSAETVYAVVGVDRETCYRMSVPAWAKGQKVGVGDTVNLLLDIKYR